jgi:hypothetical protein
MSKIIKFIPNTPNDSDLEYVQTPKPASKFIPDWWKEQDLQLKNDSFRLFDNLSFKACSPFLDSLTSGYMIYTDQDILCSIVNGQQVLTWPTSPEPLILRDHYQKLPVPAGHNKNHFAWHIHFGFKMPKGYSILITHPLNRFDLPFTTVSGIIDEEVPWGGFFTFWMQKDFSGLIKKGTPVAQIIPFKRDDWKSERADYLIDYGKKKQHEKKTYYSGFYKKFIHRKKKFE